MFMWRSNAGPLDNQDIWVCASTELGARIFISIVLATGALDTILSISTLGRYGTQMDQSWKKRIGAHVEVHEHNRLPA